MKDWSSVFHDFSFFVSFLLHWAQQNSVMIGLFINYFCEHHLPRFETLVLKIKRKPADKSRQCAFHTFKTNSWWRHLLTFCSKLPAQISKNEHIALQFILNNKGFAMQCTHLSRRKWKNVNKPRKLKSVYSRLPTASLSILKIWSFSSWKVANLSDFLTIFFKEFCFDCSIQHIERFDHRVFFRFLLTMFKRFLQQTYVHTMIS